MAVQPDTSAPLPPGRAASGAAKLVVPSLIGALVALTLGVYGRLHNPTGYAINIAGFSSPGAVKSWLATGAFVFALVQGNASATPSIREYAERKLAKLDEVLAEQTQVEVELSEQRNPSIAAGYVAEGTIFAKGPTLRAREASADMRASIDQLVDKLERQVKRYRERRSSSLAATPRTTATPHSWLSSGAASRSTCGWPRRVTSTSTAGRLRHG